MSIVALVTDKSGVLPHWQAQVSAYSAGLAPTTAQRVCECGNARVCCLCVDSEKCHSIVRLDHCTLHSYIWSQRVAVIRINAPGQALQHVQPALQERSPSRSVSAQL